MLVIVVRVHPDQGLGSGNRLRGGYRPND